MAPLAALAIFAGRVPFIVGVTVVALFAFREFARVSLLSRDRWMSGAVYLAITAVGTAALARRRSRIRRRVAPRCVLISLIPILRNRAGGGLQELSLGMIAFVYLGWMFGQLGLPRQRRPGLRLSLLSALRDGGERCGRLYLWKNVWTSSAAERRSARARPGRARSARLLVSLALPWLLRFSFPFFGMRAIDPYRTDRRDRRATRRPVPQRDKARVLGRRTGARPFLVTAAFSIALTA